jgi:hypothetical protein
VARRDTRSSSSARGGSSSKGAATKDAGPRVGRDGKVEISCPQCAAQYRIAPDKLDTKIECADCHRVFFAKTTAGKRVAAPDYTKAYIGFGLVALVLVGGILLMNSGDKPPAKPPVQAAAKAPEFNVGSHPRTAQLIKWAQGVASDNRLVLKTHSDLQALGRMFGMTPPIDEEAVVQELQKNEASYYLRQLVCDSGALAGDAAMTADTGSAVLFVTPKSGDELWKKNTRAEIEVTFKMDGTQVLVTGFKTTLPPVRNAGKADPLAKPKFVVNQDIAKPEAATITDSAGTRTVRESKPAAVPHYGKATPEQQKMADEVVAAILQSAEPEVEGAGRIFNRALQRVQSIDERKATVPRVLNAMFEQYADVNANNLKLSQLNRSLVTLTGFAVNYQIENSSDPQKDKVARESCVRQWFAFWYKYSENFAEFFESGESFDMPAADGDQKDAPKAPAK